MKERLHRILNIKFSESSQVFDLLTVQFFLGLANSFINIVAFTLFIYNFSVHTLPVVYISVALLLFVSNIGYEKIEHKLSPPHLLKFIIGLSAVLLIVFWTGLTYGNKNDFIFILLMGNTLIYMIIGFAFWGLVSLLFNVRESRRVFSVVGSGDIPAKLIGYLAAPLLIPFVGLYNLIWVAVLFLITGLLLFNKIIQKKSWDHIRKKSHVADHHPEVIGIKKSGAVSFFFKNKLIFAISILSIVSYNVFVLIDYTFISQVKTRFENIADLAIYIATFFALGRFIAVIFKLIFTSRLIERLGIINCLFITPAALFLFCLLFFMFGDDSRYNVYLFGLMALLTEVLRSTMQEPVFFILFQPLKEQLRLKGHIISKGYMLPPSLIIVGLSLLFLYRTGTPITILFTIKLILVNLCLWAIVIIFVQKAYLKTLYTSIKKGILNSEEVFISDQKGIDMLLNKVENGKKIEVIYALNLLEKAEYPHLEKLMLDQLAGPQDIEVKKFILDQLSTATKTNNRFYINLLAREQHEEVRNKLISLLCKTDPDFLQTLSEIIPDQNNDVKKIIIIELLNHQEFNYLFKAGTEINNLINSDLPHERELALSIITEVKHVQFKEAIEKLVSDTEIGVRRKAITAACKLKMKSILPQILEISELPEDKYLVLRALQSYGDSLYQDVHILEEKVLLKHIPDLIKISGKIRGQYSTQFLLAAIDKEIEQADNIVHALWAKEYEPVGEEEKARLKNLLNTYLKTGTSKINDYNGVPVLNERKMLKDSIRNEVKADLVTALRICVMLFRKKDINRMLELIEIEGNVKVFNAMEMLELMLPLKISKDINQLIDFVLDPAHRKINTLNYEMSTLYKKIFVTESFYFNPWTKAVCIYCLWKNNDTALLRKPIHTKGNPEHAIITETRNYVLRNIN